MTQPRPTAAELLEAVRVFVVDELLPDLEGRKRFHARVAANVLEMVERELTAGPEAARQEQGRLAALLGNERASTELPVDALAESLALLIRTGQADISDPDLLDHLRRTASDDVAITNPKWLEPPTSV